MGEREDLRELVLDVLDTADALELQALARMATAIARRRRIVRLDRRRDRARRAVVLEGLRELRDASTYAPPAFTVFDGGREP